MTMRPNDKKDDNDNAGSIGISTDGELTFGIGGGLAIEAIDLYLEEHK